MRSILYHNRIFRGSYGSDAKVGDQVKRLDNLKKKDNYFPIQKLANILPSNSSLVT